MGASRVRGAVRLDLDLGAESGTLGGAVGGGLGVGHAINASSSPCVACGPRAGNMVLHPTHAYRDPYEHVGTTPHLVVSRLDGAVRDLTAVGYAGVGPTAGHLVAAWHAVGSVHRSRPLQQSGQHQDGRCGPVRRYGHFAATGCFGLGSRDGWRR